MTLSCPDEYTKVTSENLPFDDVVHLITATGTDYNKARYAGWVHETVKHENADGYFKLFTNNAPHLMSEK